MVRHCADVITFTSILLLCFFFSSRRRHTRWPRDWSSDVCSSDLRSNFRQGEARHDSRRMLAAVDLYWIPLGAGAQVVRSTGKLFEAVSALAQHRQRYDLYHSALKVTVPERHFVIEMTPIPDLDGQQRGVVAEGPVGARWAGRLRLFRYEIRRWRDGVIPDADKAILSPLRVSDDLMQARRILDLVPSVPT